MMRCCRRVALPIVEHRILFFALLVTLTRASNASSRHRPSFTSFSDINCGKQVFRESFSVIKSPVYPRNITCEWYIVANPGERIEIKVLTDIDPFPVDFHRAYNDSIVILDANNFSGRQEFTLFDVIYGKINYRSKHNIVVIKFIIRELAENEGFRITYGTWNFLEQCNTDQLHYTRGRRCTGSASAEQYFSACQISSCDHHYDLKATSVNCSNGSFIPQFSCDLNEKIVEECYATALVVCPYNESQLVEYAHRNEELEENSDVCETVEVGQRNCINIDTFPNFGPPRYCPNCKPHPTAACKNKRLGYSYCVRSINNPSKYLIDCRKFSRIRSLEAREAKMHMGACYKCQRIGCSRTIYL